MIKIISHENYVISFFIQTINRKRIQKFIL